MLFDKLQDTLLLISMAVILGIVLIHYRPWKHERERNKEKNKSSKRKT
jgi:hypothetical protein